MKNYLHVLFNLSLVISAVNASNSGKKKKILSFGGNGMIGSNTMEQLISTDEYDITLVSRGSWPFDTSTTIKPFVNFIYCDREDGLDSCPTLLEHISNTTEYYAILDFSGFLPSWIEDAVKVLKDKVRVYVYVSSDSVYEVCKDGKPLGRYTKLVESDAVRPLDDKIMRELNAKDEYGDEKLGGEEVLTEQAVMSDDGGFPYISLRFADVIGPRDQTDRFATYVIWAKLHQLSLADGLDNVIPDLHVPTDVLERSSITYVNDATQSILLAMNTPNAWNEAYNIASFEMFNVTKAIEMIASNVHESYYNYKPRVIRVDAEDGIAMYPSVTRGPIRVDKAVKQLLFKPTPINRIISNTVKWYLKIFESDLEYRDMVIDEWEVNLFQDSDLFSNREHDKVMDYVWQKFPENPNYGDADGDYDDDEEDEEEL